VANRKFVIQKNQIILSIETLLSFFPIYCAFTPNVGTGKSRGNLIRRNVLRESVGVSTTLYWNDYKNVIYLWRKENLMSLSYRVNLET
jgi:hypothetical protein